MRGSGGKLFFLRRKEVTSRVVVPKLWVATPIRVNLPFAWGHLIYINWICAIFFFSLFSFEVFQAN